MGNIRGTHSSPGVYTKMTDKKQIRTRISLIANKNEDVSNISIGGGSSSKTSVTINGNVVEENGLYYVVLNAKPAVLDDITISMDINDEPKKVTMKKGSDTAKSEEVDKYCKIENVTVEPQSTSVAKYSVNKVVNPNGDGLFNVSVFNVINNEETLILAKQDKYKNTVNITATDIEGYDFINWDNGIESGDTINIEFEMPEHDVVVKCYYNIKTFTITWKNDDDDNTVLTSTTVNYGVKPEYPNENPSKVSTEKYNYTFKGWTPSITEAKEDKTYTAEYLSEIRKYEIIFVNEDGTELLRTDVEYDTMPSYNGIPTKESTQQYDYIFSGWNPEIKEVKGTATYTAQYTSKIRQYNITFIVGNKEEIIPVPYGNTPKYPDGTPTIESTPQYDYTFYKWDPEITTVTGDTEYTAIFSSTLRSYTIKFLNSEGRVLQSGTTEYGTTPTYNGPVPTKEQTDEFTYTFIGWNPAITTVTGDTEYTAQFEQSTNTYTITWKNHDEKILETDADVPYGVTPEYNGATPTREGDHQHYYVFSKWKPTITKVTGNAIYKATYTQYTQKYKITWKNYNETPLETDADVPYGATPEYNGATPTREGNAEFSYKFTGWEPAITTVTGDATYTAQFEQSTNAYTVTWKNYDNTVLTSTTVNYGETPVYPKDGPKIEKPQDDEYTYTFSGWNPEITEVTGNAEYTAVFTEIPKEYTLDINVENGTYTIKPEKETYHYNDKVTITITPNEGYEYSPLENIITITGDTILNYVCEAKKYTLTVDGTVYENIPYDSDIKPYLTYEPKEGMSHKWMEGDKEFTGTTMPNRNLILTGVYIEESTENKTIYYKAILTKDIDNINENNFEDFEFDSYEYTNDIQQVTFTVSAIPQSVEDEYWNYDDAGNEEAKKEWENQHYYEYCILAPTNVNINVEDVISSVTNLFKREELNFTINDVAYYKYHYLIDCMPTTYDQSFDMYIEIN